MTARTLIRRAIAICGSEAKLGVACGVTQGAIWKAKKAGRVSGELAVKIERATNGVILKGSLRPDLWPDNRNVVAAGERTSLDICQAAI